MENNITDVNIVVKKVYDPTEYTFKALGNLSFIELTQVGRSYMVLGLIPELSTTHNLFCSNCNYDFFRSPPPFLAAGNGELFLFISCDYCKFLSQFLIEKNAENKLKKVLDIKKEILDQELLILESQYMQ